MAATLMFHPRRGVLEVAAGGQLLTLPTQRDGARVHTWEHRFEYRSGKHTLWDRAVKVPRTSGELAFTADTAPATLEVYDYPGVYADRFDGIDKGGSTNHSYPGHSLFIGTRTNGIYIHGAPACNLATCIIVLQWDTLKRALSSEQQLSFAVSF